MQLGLEKGRREGERPRPRLRFRMKLLFVFHCDVQAVRAIRLKMNKTKTVQICCRLRVSAENL